MTIRFIIKTQAECLPRNSHRREVAKKRVPVYVRIRDGRSIDFIARTPICVYPKWWNKAREEVNSSCACPKDERNTVNMRIIDLRNFLMHSYMDDRINDRLSKDWLSVQLDRYYNRDNDGGISLQSLFSEFYADHSLSASRIRQYEVLKSAIIRFESFVREKNGPYHGRGFNFLESDDRVIFRLYDYLLNEKEYLKTSSMQMRDRSRNIRARSINTVNSMLRKIRALLNWCVNRGYLQKSPFDSYHIGGELYGTPVCMTTEEVLELYRHEYDSPALAQQRDIFVFQCNIGCRVSDLMRLTMANYCDGCISYIPKKTIQTIGRTVTVPLNSIAGEIFRKYASAASERAQRVLPCISVQKYNAAIKLMLRKAGITRPVTVLDPLTRTEKSVPICDMASSHMARRTFINNIYRKVKDPSLVASLTGHSEGSRAFARYRNIDTEIKKDLVKVLEK